MVRNPEPQAEETGAPAYFAWLSGSAGTRDVRLVTVVVAGPCQQRCQPGGQCAPRFAYRASVCGARGETPKCSARLGIGQPSCAITLAGSSASKVGNGGSVTVRGSRR